MKDKLIGKTIDYLTILEKYSNNQVICQCICGKKIIKDISYFKNKQIIKSCGCGVSKQSLPSLYQLWKKMNKEEKSNWGDWQDFVKWAKLNKYSEMYSYHKINRKLPYNKDNLEFGIFINKEFFSIQRLRKNRIVIDEELWQFVISQRIKDLIVSDTEITRRLTYQTKKHKTLPIDLFKLLK